MGRGVAFPPRVDRRGGVPMTTDNLDGLITASLMPDSSTNPYNRVLEIGTVDRTYTQVDLASKADVRQMVTRRFNQLNQQGRARLLKLEVRSATGTGKMRALITYLPLETPGAVPRDLDLVL